jgi:hypothetical protein
VNARGLDKHQLLCINNPVKKLTLPAFVVLSVALAAALVFSSMTAADLRNENQSLRKQIEAFTALEPKRAETAPAPTTEAPDSELIRLRGEVVTLRQQKTELDQARKENENLRLAQAQERERARAEVAAAQAQAQRPTARPVGNLPRDSWAFAGYENPEAAMQSLLWAGAAGNAEALLASFTPDQLKRMQTEDNQNRTEQEVLDRTAKQIAKIKAFQILTVDSRSADEAVVTMFLDGLEGSEQTQRMKMQRINNVWRLAGPDRGGEK